MDQVHGAYVALFMESLYPEGLSDTADVEKEWEGYGLRAISPWLIGIYLTIVMRVVGEDQGSGGRRTRSLTILGDDKIFSTL